MIFVGSSAVVPQAPAVEQPIAPAPTLDALLAKVRGKEYPGPTATEKAKSDFVQKLFQEGEVDALSRYKQATHNLLYYNDRQWITWKKSERAFVDLPNPDDEPRVTKNYIKPILNARAARLTSSAVNFTTIPDSNAYEDRDRAEVARRFFTAAWRRQGMEYRRSRSLPLAFCSGFVAWKSFWNKDLGTPYPATKFLETEQGQIEVYVDDSGQPIAPTMQLDPMSGQPVEAPPPDGVAMLKPGDTDTALRTVFNIRLNSEAQGWTASDGLRWLIDSEVLPLSTAREKFPDIADRIQPLDSNETSVTFEKINQGLVRQSTMTASSPYVGKASAGQPFSDMAVIREYWELPCDKYFPDGRLIVVVGGAIAYDGPFPDGIFPYDPLFDEPGTFSPYGYSTVNTLTSPQDVINRQWTAITIEAEESGIGRFVSWGVPGVPDQITTKSSKVIQIPMRNALNNRSIKDVFTRLDPAMVSPDRYKAIELAKAAMFDIGGYHEVSRGQIPPGLDSGVAIEKLLESESGQLKNAVDAQKGTIISWARKQLTIAKRRYNDIERWIPVDRPDMNFLVEAVTGAHLPDPETLIIDLENFKPQSEAANRAEIKDLLMNKIIDPRTGVKLMDLGRGVDGAFASSTRHYAKARSENISFERGAVALVPGPQGLPTFVSIETQSPLLLPFDDDHNTHIDVHQEVLLDVTKPWPMRQAIQQHIMEHRQAAMMQLMAMAPPAPPPEEGQPQE